MPSRKKTIEESLQQRGSHPDPKPHDKVEPLHIDEIHVLARVLAYMLSTHPDATRRNTFDIFVDVKTHFHAPLRLNLQAMPKPQPRRDVAEAARLVIGRYLESQPRLGRGTIFEDKLPGVE